MEQITKTITKLPVSPEEMAAFKAAELKQRAERKETERRRRAEEREAALARMMASVEAKVQEHAKSLLQWAADESIHKNWTYMPRKNVYYIPEIVGVMLNLRDFVDVTFQRCNNSSSFQMPSDAYMKFADFQGDLPTPYEAERCFRQKGIHFTNDDGYIPVNSRYYTGVTFYCTGVTVKTRDTVGYYDICNGIGDRYACNIPIYRFNGENSPAVSAAQTLLYWLQYDLRPAAFEEDDANRKAVAFLRKCYAYLRTEGNVFRLDAAKVRQAIDAGEKLAWMPKGAAELSAPTDAAEDADEARDELEEMKALKEKFKNRFLHADEYAIALDPYDDKLLTDPNRGHWDIWGQAEDADEDALWVDIDPGFTARNPAADVSGGIVAIDFGTKSTVVVYETDNLQVMPLQVGSGTYSKGMQAKNYENPTVLQFISLENFLTAYAAKEGRPATRWDDLTVSHNAFQNLKDASSEMHGTFFEGLKQWCGTSGQRLKLQDAEGKIWELPPFMELEEDDMNPLEIYAYYLGRYINHMLRGKIFLHYVISFPVTYEHRIREHMSSSIRKGLRKSFPLALLKDEAQMKNFCVREVASEPAAYAITALEEYNFEPEGAEQVYYAVFDFGGGTTDFDFGMFKESTDDRYDYVLTHFGENGDRTLGGENLLRLLAFEVFRANKDYLLHPDGESAADAGEHIPFAMAPDAKLFTGHESLIKNSREAQQNMRNLMEKLRPVWEAPDSEEAQQLVESGQIQLTLYRENGEKKTDANLKLKLGDKEVNLQAILKERIEQGVQRFFTALAEAFDKSAGSDSRIAALSDVPEISVFLAGNSSRSPLVSALFHAYLGTMAQPEAAKSDAAEEKAQGKEGLRAAFVRAAMKAAAQKLNAAAVEEGTLREVLDVKHSARELLRFGDAQKMPEFLIYPPLGTPEADAIREERMGEDEREPMMRPTGKSGVAYGLLQCREGGAIKVESITPDGERVPFQYYIGRRKKGKFRLIIDRNAKMKTWYKFIDAGGAFDLLYTDRPEAATGDAPMTIAKQKHIAVEHPDASAFVYLRPVESRVIEYMIAHDESELTQNGGQTSDPIRIELE